MAIKHTFVSAKSDGADTSMVRPSDWNADHTIDDASITYAKLQNVSATDRLLGRSSSGAGVVQEITCTAAGRALIDDADAAAQRTTLGLGTLATQSGTFSGTSSGTNTGDQLVFKTISVSGQSDVVADTTTDTVTLAASGNLSITTNASTDTVTFTGTEPTQAFIIPCSDETTALTTGTAKATFRAPYPFVLTDVRASLSTAQASGSIFTVDVNSNGASILSTKLTVDNTEKTSATAATPKVTDVYGLVDDAEVSIDIDQVGDGTAKGLKLNIIGYRYTPTPLLDTYTGAAAAYSVRKLSNTYTGSALRVRRSSDNAEQDIGFDSSGNLDESALTTFVGANSGYVTKWYDQTGNGKHVEQTTSANQPRIVNAGTVDKVGGRVKLVFDGTNDLLSGGDILSVGSNAMLAIGVAQIADNCTFFAKSKATNAQSRYSITVPSGTTYALIQNSSNVDKSAVWNSRTDDRSTFAQQFIPNTSNSLYVNGDRKAIETSSVGTIGSSSFRFLIGAYNNSTDTGEVGHLNGIAQELVVYLSDKSSTRSAIEFNINNYYSIY